MCNDKICVDVKKVYVRLYGGLGNQLFQYAFGKCVSKRHSAELILEIESGFKNDFFGRKYSLNELGINVKTMLGSGPLNSLVLSSSLLGKIYRVIGQKFSLFGFDYYKEKMKFEYNDDVFKCNKDIFFDGYWQNYNYFDGIIDVLRGEMQLDNLNEMESSFHSSMTAMSVAVHMRYPHAFSNGKVHGGSVDHFCRLDFAYFEKAISNLREIVPNHQFCFFSDNIEWAQEKVLNANLGVNAVFINTGSAISDFKLMCQCEHFIISNSTFSWWAAYLSTSINKRVISPRHWFNKIDLVALDFFPSSWLLIDN